MSDSARARQLIDEAHARDPARAPDGRPAELVYADRVEAWVGRLVPGRLTISSSWRRAASISSASPCPAANFLSGGRAIWPGAGPFT